VAVEEYVLEIVDQEHAASEPCVHAGDRRSLQGLSLEPGGVRHLRLRCVVVAVGLQRDEQRRDPNHGGGR